jgi:hypothetical protein
MGVDQVALLELEYAQYERRVPMMVPMPTRRAAAAGHAVRARA